MEVFYFVYMTLVIVLSIPDHLLWCIFHVRVNEETDQWINTSAYWLKEVLYV